MTDVFSLIKSEAQNCINCGFCSAVCPTLEAFGFRESMGARGRVILAKSLLEGSEVKAPESFFSCLDCYACYEVCPAKVNPGKISEYVKQAVSDGLIDWRKDPVAEMLAKNIIERRDPLGLKDELTDWAEGLEFSGSSETILYTGHMYQLIPYAKALSDISKKVGGVYKVFASLFSKFSTPSSIFSMLYDKELKERAKAQLRSIYFLLKKAGLSFSYLGSEEPYPGTLLYDLGYISEFKSYAQQVSEIFKEKGVKNIITVDPHTFEVLTNKYKAYVKGFDFNVTFWLDHLSGLSFSSSGRKITYHEPCHLVRHTDHNVPKLYLQRVGELIMPAHSGKNTFCCGGPIESLFPKESERISEKRFAELKSTGAELIVTSCPICFVNLNKDPSVLEVSELLMSLVK